ncbi:MAG: hypothetical protein IPH64_09690 [Comamonadaceae bacterium]|nr:hypothetical protein [Comamonadaceae bacterium]
MPIITDVPGRSSGKVMAGRGKLTVIRPRGSRHDLLDIEYGDCWLSFPLLALLFRSSTKQLHHIDHFFRRANRSAANWRKPAATPHTSNSATIVRDRLANLQLLEGLLIVSKNDSLPWYLDGETYPAVRHHGKVVA